MEGSEDFLLSQTDLKSDGFSDSRSGELSDSELAASNRSPSADGSGTNPNCGVGGSDGAGESQATPYLVLASVACFFQGEVAEEGSGGLENRCPRRPMGHSRVVCEVQHYSIFCGFVIEMIQLVT